jgi:hypothetical protein
MNRKLSEGKQEKELDNANTLRSLTLDNLARNCLWGFNLFTLPKGFVESIIT